MVNPPRVGGAGALLHGGRDEAELAVAFLLLLFMFVFGGRVGRVDGGHGEKFTVSVWRRLSICIFS